MILDAAQAGGLVVCVGCVLICAWSAMRSRQKVRDLDADLTRLWTWTWEEAVPWMAAAERRLYGTPQPTPHPRPLDEEPDTVIAHPSATRARQQHLLDRTTPAAQRQVQGQTFHVRTPDGDQR